MTLKRFFSLVFVILALISIGGCSKNTTTAAAKGEQEKSSDSSQSLNGISIEITDMEGRTVKLEKKPERLLIIGSALRLYTYIAGTEGLVGVERAQQNTKSGRPYIMANPALAELPVIGEGFPNNPDPELIAGVNPDVIIAGDIMEKDSLERLQENIGVPVVITKCGADPVFDDTTYEAMRIIGKTTGNEARVKELITYMDDCREELAALTKDIPEEERPSIYMGGLASRGIHGIDSTKGMSALLMAINAKNVVDELGAGHFFIDKEKLVEWDPDVLIIDQNGISVVLEDYQKNPDYYEALSAVENGRVYGQLPYTSYYSNVETALADVYYIGKLLYPDAFSDIDPAKKADEIYTFMLGEPLYEQMAAKFGGFGPVILGE